MVAMVLVAIGCNELIPIQLPQFTAHNCEELEEWSAAMTEVPFLEDITV